VSEFKVGDHVVVTRGNGMRGTVASPPHDGRVYVRLEHGTSCAFPLAEVALMEDKMARGVEHKTWPLDRER
jgi:hypothetical protein